MEAGKDDNADFFFKNPSYRVPKTHVNIKKKTTKSKIFIPIARLYPFTCSLTVRNLLCISKTKSHRPKKKKNLHFLITLGFYHEVSPGFDF